VTPTPFDGLPLDLMQVVNDRCNRYEAALRAGGRPDVEEFLIGLAPVVRQSVLAELRALDAEYRQAAGGGARTLGEYDIEAELGHGGMGTVYLARHRLLDRKVAVKVMAPHLADTPAARDRFRREMRLAGRLAHPNLVAVHDAAEDHGRLYLVSEYIDGTDLSALVRRGGPIPAARAVNYIIQAARGLGHAHERGIVHRDVKPSNLILGTDGVVRVLDLGLARATEPDFEGPTELTATGQMLGTPAYVAPEQARSPAIVDVRADVYGLGGALHYLLFGRPADVRIDPGRAPGRVVRVLRQMLAEDPKDRPSSMTDVIRRLEVATRSPRMVLLLVGLGLAAALATIVAVWPRRDGPPPVVPSADVTVADMPVADPTAYQRAWADRLGQPVEFTDDLDIHFVLVPPGRYRIGEDRDGPVVTVERAFYLSQTEVTVGQLRTLHQFEPFETVVEALARTGRSTAYGKRDGEWHAGAGRRWDDAGPELPIGPDFPAINLTWDDAVQIARRMTQRSPVGRVYRLPTEVEWEHACRAGGATTWAHGDDVNSLDRSAVFARTDPVAVVPGRRPNAWGLCDLHGNLREWVGDPAAGLPGPDEPDFRMMRGGKFDDLPADVRSAARVWEHRYKPMGGLRLVAE
jgi:formylglycine-generating enzyme required for sulfatase activity/tRNA A-37 threonylcarbamoyl transferase component Bud32